MESLALAAAIILLTMILAGPIAIGLTFLRISNPILNMVRRIVLCFFSALGIGLGLMLIFEGIALGGKFFALFALGTGAYALKREFVRKRIV